MKNTLRVSKKNRKASVTLTAQPREEKLWKSHTIEDNGWDTESFRDNILHLVYEN